MELDTATQLEFPGGVIDRLVDKRFVAREVSTKDRRARVLTLTDSGAAALAQVQAASQSVQDTICQGLSDADQAMLVELLTRISENHPKGQ